MKEFSNCNQNEWTSWTGLFCGCCGFCMPSQDSHSAAMVHPRREDPIAFGYCEVLFNWNAPPPLNMNAPPKTYTEPQAAFQELLFWGLYNSWIELNFCQVREYPRTCMLTYADSIHGNRQCTTLVQNHKIMVVKNLQRNWQKYDGY